MPNFEDWFKEATGHKPYPFQVRFACDQAVFQHLSLLEGEGGGEGVLVEIPTGPGRTAMAVLGWLWRRPSR